MEGADGAGEQAGVVGAEAGGAGGVGGLDPGVVVPGGQDRVPVQVEVGAEGGQVAAPDRGAVADLEGGQGGGRAGEGADHRLDGAAGAAGGPGPVVVGDRQDGGGLRPPPPRPD